MQATAREEDHVRNLGLEDLQIRGFVLVWISRHTVRVAGE
jgi:hypothetical protein